MGARSPNFDRYRSIDERSPSPSHRDGLIVKSLPGCVGRANQPPVLDYRAGASNTAIRGRRRRHRRQAREHHPSKSGALSTPRSLGSTTPSAASAPLADLVQTRMGGLAQLVDNVVDVLAFAEPLDATVLAELTDAIAMDRRDPRPGQRGTRRTAAAGLAAPALRRGAPGPHRAATRPPATRADRNRVDLNRRAR
jgi:hypothetical protein